MESGFTFSPGHGSAGGLAAFGSGIYENAGRNEESVHLRLVDSC